MSEVDEIEELLEKALKQRRRSGWLKTLVVAVVTMVGAAVSAGKGIAAVVVAVNNIPTKDDMAKLVAGQQKQIDDLVTRDSSLAGRVTALEPVASSAAACCSTQTTRIDHLFSQPMQVRSRW